jgi:hypothetical protein
MSPGWEVGVRLLSIGAFARATRLTPKALRLYDDLGLLPHSQVALSQRPQSAGAATRPVPPSRPGAAVAGAGARGG